MREEARRELQRSPAFEIREGRVVIRDVALMRAVREARRPQQRRRRAADGAQARRPLPPGPPPPGSLTP